MSVFGHEVCDTAGTGATRIGWNDQKARCSGVMTYPGVLATAGVGLSADALAVVVGAVAEGLPAEADGELLVAVEPAAKAGHGAPALTQSTSASTSAAVRRPPFGIFRVARVCRTASISRLLSGSPGTITGPDLPPLSSASRESTRRPPIRSSAWQS